MLDDLVEFCALFIVFMVIAEALREAIVSAYALARLLTH